MARKNHQPKTGTFSLTQLTREDLEIIASALGDSLVAINTAHDRCERSDARLRVGLRERAQKVLALKSVIE